MKTTKPEIIGILFAKLNPKKDETFADIGCGSGTVSEFFAPHVRRVYAVDNDLSAIELARERLSGFENVEVIHADGYEFLKEKEIDLAFFGGTKGIERMLEVCRARKIAVNAARMEVAVSVMNKMRELNIFREMLIVNVSYSYDLAGGTAFKSGNPVFMVIGDALRR